MKMVLLQKRDQTHGQHHFSVTTSNQDVKKMMYTLVSLVTHLCKSEELHSIMLYQYISSPSDHYGS